MQVSDLPALNASLNALSAVLLVAGYICIRRGQRLLHKRCMLAALVTSSVFLTSYLIYHYSIGGSKPYGGVGAIRYVYYTILITHIVLAFTVPFFALITAWRGLRDQLERHVRIARWALPIWLYVSVTGVIVYWMLYQ